MKTDYRWIARYAAAVAAVAAALLIRLWTTALVGGPLPHYVTFFPAIMLVALLAGMGPGIVATMAAAMAADYWVLEPQGFGIGKLNDAVGLGLFLFMGVFMSAVAGRSRRIQGHIEALVAQRTSELALAQDELRQMNAGLEQRVAAQTALIRQANETLEQRVAERTAELQGANALLLESRSAALNLTDDAVAARRQAEQAEQKAVTVARKYALNLKEHQTILNSVPAMVFYKDRENRFVRTNRSFEATMGLPKEALEGRSLFDLYPREQAEAYWRDDKEVMDSNLSKIGIVEPMTAGNQTRWVQTDKVPYLDEAGNVIGVIGFAVDITKRKQAEEALRASHAAALNLMEDAVGAQERTEQANAELRESEEQLKRAQEIARLGSWELDLARNILVWSDEVYRIFGLQPQEFGATYEAFLEHVHPDDRAIVDTAYASSLRESRDSYEIEHRVVRQDNGEIRVVHEKCEHIRDASGAIFRSVGMVHDITERKQAEAALRESEERYRALTALAPDALFLADQEGRFLDVNIQACRSLGYSREQLLKMQVADIEKDFDAQNVKRILGQVPSGEAITVEGHHRRQDGICFPVEVRITTFGIQNRQVFLTFARDISERKRAETALKWSAGRNEILSRTAARLLATDNPQALTEALCLHVMDFLDCQVFFNFLVDEQPGRLRLNACGGIPEQESKKIEWLDYGVAVCGCVARDRERIIAEDIQNSDNPRTELIKSFGVQAYCCHPIMVQDRLIGTLSFGAKNRPRFRGEELDMMRTVTDLVAVAMQRRHTLDEVELARTDAVNEKSRLEAVMQTLPVGMALVDNQGGNIRSNAAFEQVWGGPRPTTQSVGDYAGYQAWWADSGRLVQPEEWASARAVRRGETVTGQLMQIQGFDGARRFIINSAAPIYDANGAIAGSAVAIQDITQLKQTEMALERERTNLQTIFNLVNVGMLLIAEDGAVQRVNNTISRWLGKDLSGHIGVQPGNLVGCIHALGDSDGCGHTPHCAACPIRNTFESVLRTGRAVHDVEAETVLVAESGEARLWLELNADPLELDGKRHVILALNNITLRKQAEAALRKSEEQVRRVLNSLFAFVGVCSPEGILQDANHSPLEAAGITLEDVRGKRFEECYWWSHSAPLQSHMRQAVELAAQGRSSRFDAELLTAGGLPISIDFMMAPMQDEQGRITHLIASAVDISQRKMMEEALRESEGRFRSVVNASPDAIMISSEDGLFMEANPASARIFGLPADKLIGRAIVHFLDPGFDFTAMRAELKKRGRLESEHRLTRADGVVLNVESYEVANVLPGRHLSIIHDVTERKKREEELGKLNRILRALTSSDRARMRATQEEKYLKEVCENIVRDCGHVMAWVGYAVEDEAKSVRPVAHAGREEGYLETVRASWADTERGRGPTGTAIRTGKPRACRNMLSDPSLAPWREQAFKRGYAASLALPLAAGGKVFGALTIYFHEPDPFSEDELKLLTELADDLAHGVSALQLREAHAKAEEALAQSRAEAEEGKRILDALMEHIPEGITIADAPDAKVRMVSRYGKELLGGPHAGMSAGEVAHQWKIFHKNGLTRMPYKELPLVRAVQKAEIIKNEELIQINEAGRSLPLLCNAAPLRDASGAVFGGIVAWRDISEIKQAQEDLLKSEERYRSLFNGMTEGFAIHEIICDENGTPCDYRFLDINAAFERLTGLKREDVVGKLMTHVLPTDDPRWIEIYGKVALTGEAVHFDNYSPALGKHFEIFAYRPAPRQFAVVFMDVTQRKLMEDDLVKAKADLEMRVQERTAQIRSLALELAQAEQRERKRLAEVLHDHLQQLLVGAKMGMQVALKKVQGKSLQESLKHTSGLLDESIAASKSLTMELSPPILHEAGLVAALNWLARWMGSKHGLTVTVAADTEIEPDPEGVCVLLFQCVRELLFNIVKHAGVKLAHVLVEWLPDGQIHIVVSDEGAGFDPARAANKDSAGGFGLFSIRERLSLLAGKLQVESAPNAGARVSLTAPLAQLAKVETQAQAESTARQTPIHRRKARRPAAKTQGRKIRVLVADDHKIMREGLRQLLAGESGIEVVGEAENGEIAVEMAMRLHPDIVIMDISMPRMNGIEATRQLTADAPGIRIIGLSMYEEADRATAMMQAGAVAYLHKAGPAENLIATIKSHSNPPKG